MATKSILAKLDIVERPASKKLTPIQKRREKLLNRLSEQQQMIEAELNGETYRATKQAWTTCPTTGQKVKTTVNKRTNPWYFVDGEGVWYFEPRYGNRPLPINSKGSVIKAGAKADLPEIIQNLTSAIQVGELDSQLMAYQMPARKTGK